MVSVSSSTTGVYTSQINRNERSQTQALNTTSSGKKVSKASDNAASLAIASQLGSDVSTLRQAGTNLLQGTSVLQTADGALEQTGNILNRMKELSTQANSGALDSNSRSAINDEYQSLKNELNNLSSNTTFNGQPLLNGSYSSSFQSGTTGGNTLDVDLTGSDISSTGLGLTAGAGDSASALLSQTTAQSTSAELDTAIQNLNTYRSQVGAYQSSFTTRGDNVSTDIESAEAAQSALVDADIGAESTNLSNSKLISELSIAAAAQGNKLSSSILRLVR